MLFYLKEWTCVGLSMFVIYRHYKKLMYSYNDRLFIDKLRKAINKPRDFARSPRPSISRLTCLPSCLFVHTHIHTPVRPSILSFIHLSVNQSINHHSFITFICPSEIKVKHCSLARKKWFSLVRVHSVFSSFRNLMQNCNMLHGFVYLQ